MDHIKRMISMLGEKEKAGFDRIKPAPPKKDPGELHGLLPLDGKTYDIVDVIERIVDNSEFEQFKEYYGKTIVCGYGRIDGWAVGIVANQRKIVKTKKGEMQLGGVIYNDSADAAIYSQLQSEKIPLVFTRCNWFYGWQSQQRTGIIKMALKW
jgi:acetyl-CoA carboxylase carboxyltransferase component